MRHKPTTSFLYRTTIVFTALVMTVFPNITAFAFDELFYSSNDILYYEPGSACVNPGTSYTTRMDIATLTGSNNSEKIWNFLTHSRQGLSKEQAAGVMGNIGFNSGFKSDLEEDGLGIMQWKEERREALESAAEDHGVPATDLGFQLSYMVQESQSRQVSSAVADQGLGSEGANEWDTLKELENIEDATVFWRNNFEVSADSPDEVQDKETVLSERGELSENAFTAYKDLSTTDQPGQPTSKTPAVRSGECSDFAGGDLIQTLLAYAHPTYSEPRYPLNPEPKPAYIEAAKKAESEGKWVGGGTQEIGVPGIDCGGFVSLLLTQSGFEPDYNYGLDLSRGASNQEYGQQPWAEKYWTYLGRGKEINVSDLRPGDVAYSSGHTFIFVGQVDGFESQYASASYSYSGRSAGGWNDGVSWRPPMAAGSWDGGYESATNPDYVWYGRREGTPPPYGSTNRADPGQGTRES